MLSKISSGISQFKLGTNQDAICLLSNVISLFSSQSGSNAQSKSDSDSESVLTTSILRHDLDRLKKLGIHPSIEKKKSSKEEVIVTSVSGGRVEKRRTKTTSKATEQVKAAAARMRPRRCPVQRSKGGQYPKPISNPILQYRVMMRIF